MKSEHSIEEIRAAIKKIEGNSNVKTGIVIATAIIALIAVAVVVTIKIKDKLAWEALDDYDDDYDFDFDDFEDIDGTVVDAEGYSELDFDEEN